MLNHVCKRLGTALRNVVSDCQKRKVTLGGLGGVASIRRNRTVEDMRKAIMASVYRGFCTDSEPCHDYCTPGEDSWCFYQQALAQGRQPGPHEKFVHTPLDRKLLEEHIMPIYERLAEEHLLSTTVDVCLGRPRMQMSAFTASFGPDVRRTGLHPVDAWNLPFFVLPGNSILGPLLHKLLQSSLDLLLGTT